MEFQHDDTKDKLPTTTLNHFRDKTLQVIAIKVLDALCQQALILSIQLNATNRNGATNMTTKPP